MKNSKSTSKAKQGRQAGEKRQVRWSFSAWATEQSCPFRYYGQYILGIRDQMDEDNPAIIRGNLLHKKQENFLIGKISGVPREFLPFKRELTGLKKASPIVEQWWGVDADWKPIKWGSWTVFKMDAAVLPTKKDNTLWIQDLKTGREYPKHADQAELGACLGFAQHPKVDEVQVEFWYIDQGIIRSYEYSAKELKRATKRWQAEGDRLLTPRKKYLPAPTEDNCRWCPVSSKKGGPCHAWKKLQKGGS